MKIRSSPRILLAAWLLTAISPASTLGSEGDKRIEGWARQTGQSRPLMRIGLAAGHRIEIGGDRPYRVLDPVTGKTVWKARFSATLQAVAEGGPTGEIGRVFRVQVGAFSSSDAADRERKRLVAATGAPGVVHHDPDRGTYRVRMGKANDRLALGSLMQQLRESGLDGLWIAEEPIEDVQGVALRLVDESFDSFPTGVTRLVVVPDSGGRIEVDGKRYRGVVELRVSPFGTVRPINWVGLERYLLGVVPAELGPEVWPELEALKAQSVAARTYAWRNRGQFEGEGFDLCATPRCQVYEGVKVEHPLSDRAIHGTRGEVLVHGGRPIVALYTATCGGHTEDGANIFAEHGEPYLKGVPCRAENAALATLRGTLRGRALEPLFDETGAEITLEAALLASAGVLAADQLTQKRLSGSLTGEELRAHTTSLARVTGLAAPQGALPGVGDLGQAAAGLVADLNWNERATVLLSEQDLPALLRDPVAVALPERQRRAVAYLAWTEGLRPFPDGSFQVGRAPSLARLIPAMARIAETYKAFGLRKGVVSGVGKSSLRLIQGKGEIRLPLAAAPFIFGRTAGKPVPRKELEVWPGDRVRFRTDAKGAIDFIELQPPVKGVTDDRSAAVYSWEVRRTRRQLETTINRRVSVGKLQDLRVVRRGVSGRAVELEVVGSKATTTVRGFGVRGILDLREILTVIEIQRNEQGEIQAVVFAGKGWGHGVGMCQVGAYGMALRDASYKEILTHYYQGTAIEKLSVPPG